MEAQGFFKKVGVVFGCSKMPKQHSYPSLLGYLPQLSFRLGGLRSHAYLSTF